MNRIFVTLIAVAFVCAAVREILVQIPWEQQVHSVGWARMHDPWAIGQGLASWVDRPPADAAGHVATPMEELGLVIFDKAKSSVLDVALKIAGPMTLMLGLMKVVEAGGGLGMMAKLIRPVMVRLFPDVPADHPAMGAMIMNIAANALGLGNAATPFGIRAIEELDKLNPHKGTATNAMALFLAINTSGVTLLATGAMVMRMQSGSQDLPGGIIGTTLFATSCSTVAAVIICKLLERVFPAPAATNPVEPYTAQTEDAYPLYATVAFFAGIAIFVLASFRFQSISTWMIPMLVAGFIGFGHARGVDVYATFVDGAKEGFTIAMRIIPYLVAILVMVGMLTTSGAMDAFTGLVGPLSSKIGLPAQAIPMALIRPLSGSGATGLMVATLQDKTLAHSGLAPADTYVGYLVSTMAGSSETTFYVLAVYYGAVGVKNGRHAVWCGITADIFGVIGSIIAVQLYFAFVLHRAAI